MSGSRSGLLINGVEQVRQLVLPVAPVIPPLIQDLEAEAMILETLAFVRKQKKAGKSLSAVQQQGLTSRWKSWSWNFIPESRWIETLYQAPEG